MMKEKEAETRVLTDEQKAEYIEHKGMRCPVCKSESVCQDHNPDITEYGIFINCMCDDCGEEWVDKYVLTEVDLAEAVDGRGFLDGSLDEQDGNFDMDDEFDAEEEIGYEEPVVGHADDDWKDDGGSFAEDLDNK